MTFDSEDAVKKALAIDSWRNLSKDKLLRFVAMMPDMDKEVAVRTIEQFPQFKEFGSTRWTSWRRNPSRRWAPMPTAKMPSTAPVRTSATPSGDNSTRTI